MTSMPPHCPSCQHEMVVTELTCTNCDTAITGYYPLSVFSQLSDDSLQFLENFVRNRGNVKEMERETGESYWVIRNQLDKVIAEMGFEETENPADLPSQRKAILDQVSAGEISADEAARLLSELGK